MGKIRLALPAMQNYRGFCCAVENVVLPDLDGGRVWGTGRLLHVVFASTVWIRDRPWADRGKPSASEISVFLVPFQLNEGMFLEKVAAKLERLRGCT